MEAMIPGRATTDGTARYVTRFASRLPADHFRAFHGGLRVSSLGIGTYLGREDDATDQAYEKAVTRALERGINVVDSAVNYRHQRSERAIGRALAAGIARGAFARDEILLATKGGFIPFDGGVPPDPRAYFSETYVRTGIVQPGDVAGGAHCMTPRYLDDQIERSRANLGVETIDVYYVHNPESELGELDREAFMTRMREAFTALEHAAADGRIAVYGTATWNGYRQDPSETDYLSLVELTTLARQIAGDGHHFRVIQLPYNLAMPEAFTRGNQRLGDAMVSALDAAGRLGLYVMASAPIYQGKLAQNLPPVIADFLPGLATDAQRALQFVRSTPGVGTALVGMKSLGHVEENAGVAAAPPVPWEQFQRLFTAA
jgi:aryl-alcohol dehydrogenase-like predicted oxidoreductase